MGSFDTRGDFFTILVEDTEKVIQENKGLINASNDILNYIIDSAKQMAAFLQTYVYFVLY